LPIRASTRPPKPSAKKRSPSPSQHAPRRSKKPKAHSSAVSTIPEPLLSIRSNAKLIEISDKEEEEEEDNNADEEEDIEDDDAEEEEEEEEEARLFKFKTTWKAFCGKEQLPGIQSAYFMKGALFMIDIELWKKKVLHDLQPRSFWVVSLLATASHEKCRQADEFP
jgi:hypothetical protein